MTRNEALAVAVRLFALVVILWSLRSIPASWSTLSYSQADNIPGVAFVIFTHVLLILIGVALWRFPQGISALLLPKPSGTAPTIPWSQEATIELASIVIGLFYLTYAISDLLYWLPFLIASANMEGGVRLDADQWASIIATPLEAAVALVLIFGSRGVARLIRSARYGT